MTRTIRQLVAAGLVLGLSAAVPAADLPKWLRWGKNDAPTEDRIVAGLKEALRVGTENAVAQTGQPGGYFDNPAIKIEMPESLRKLDKGLRAIGLGQQLDEFVLGMNRAAETAAPAAKQIIWDAVKTMSFEDAKKIYKGGDTAATDYFRETTTEQLMTAFTPIVDEAMAQVGVTKQFEQLMSRYQKIPFAGAPDFDLDRYVVTEALDGLFAVLGEEERKIRKDPAARVTDVLQEVFGKR